MSWIKMRHNLASDPDVIAIAADLELDEFAVVGRLHAFWSWLDQHSTDGRKIPITRALIDRIVSKKNFAKSLEKVGWLKGEDGAISIPNYVNHNGETAKKRALTARRVGKHRAQKRWESGNAASVTGVTQRALEDKRRVDKEKKKKRKGLARPAANAAGSPRETPEEHWLRLQRESEERLRGGAEKSADIVPMPGTQPHNAASA